VVRAVLVNAQRPMSAVGAAFSNPSSLDASIQDHRVTLPTGYAKPVKNAFVSGDRTRLILNPAEEIISCTPRQIIDGFNAVFAEGHEHQRGESRNVFEFIRNTKLFSPRFDLGLNLLRHTDFWILPFGIGIDGIGQPAMPCLPRNAAPTSYIHKMGLTPK
jgi:hypothetical protein